MKTEQKKIELHLAGPSKGAPSFDDVMALFKKLAGREPTPAEVQEARAAWDSQ